MKYAVIQSGGKQYLVKEGQTLAVDKLDGTGDTVSFDKVLMMVNDGDIVMGKPFLTSTTVTAKVLGQVKGPKVRVSTYKAKVRERRVIGFRAQQTKVQIEPFSGSKTVKEAAEATEKPARRAVKKTTK